VVSYPEACEARLPWRISRCSREKLCFHHLAAPHGGDCSRGGTDRSRAIAGSRRSAPAGKGLSAATATSDATDFSARRRYYRGGGGAAAAAAFAGIVGTGIAIAASQNRRDDYYYGGAPPITTVARPITAGPLLRQPAVLWRIWLSQVQRALFQRSSRRRLVIAGIPNGLIRRPRWRGRRFL